ncbi:hypothetical protein AAG906_010072 [Vitis piasezkii]
MTPAKKDLYREEKCQYCGMVGHIAKICWWGDLYVLSNSPELYFSHRFKSDLDIWHQYLGHPSLQFNKKIKVFHSDGRGEFINFKLSSHFLSTGIIHQVSCPYTPEQIGMVELSEQSFNTPYNDIEPNQLGMQSQTHQKQTPKTQPSPSMITRSQTHHKQPPQTQPSPSMITRSQ